MARFPTTTEFVSDGHPDKFCDRVSDAIPDAALDAARALGAADNSPDHPRQQRTAVEVLAKDRLVVVSGEIKLGPNVKIDVPAIVKRAWADVGYDDPDSITVIDHLQLQSPELTVSSTKGDGENLGEGAGDQGIMVGYATDETPEFMPKSWQLARNLCWKIRELRVSAALPWLRSDTKTQVTLDADGRPGRVVIAAQHAKDHGGALLSQDDIKEELMRLAVHPILGDITASAVTVNGTKSFVVGGTIGDCGLTGRKIVIDQYGPTVPVGGGAFSGKDPTKVDRSAAYMARMIAKTAVAMKIGGAKSCTVTIAYAIGKTSPEMVTAVTDGGKDISDWVLSRFPDLSPRAIIDRLGLLRTGAGGDLWNYRMTSSFGHFGGRDFPWETIPEISD